MGALLLGAPREGRSNQPGDDRGPAVPGGEIYLSFPGLGDRLAARIAAEIGDITTFTTDRGRDRPRGRPPAQIPACATNALGSSLGYDRQTARWARGVGRGAGYPGIREGQN